MLGLKSLCELIAAHLYINVGMVDTDEKPGRIVESLAGLLQDMASIQRMCLLGGNSGRPPRLSPSPAAPPTGEGVE